MSRNEKAVRVVFPARGETSEETAWAEAVPSPRGKLHVRLDNILFFRPEPVLGDILEVEEDAERQLVFTRVVKKGGRHAVVFDYVELAHFALVAKRFKRAFDALVEGSSAPYGKTPGRMFVAAPRATKPRALYELAAPIAPGIALVYPVQKGIPDEAKVVRPALREVDQALLAASQKGDVGGVRQALKGGAKVECRDDAASNTPLLLAAKHDHGSVVKVLLAAGASLDAANDFRQTALEWAVRNGNAPLFRMLLRAGARLGKSGPRLLQQAAAEGNAVLVRALLAQGVAPNEVCPNGSTPIFAAALRDRPTIVRLLARAGARADAQDSDGTTPLVRAAFRGSGGALKELLRMKLPPHDLEHALINAVGEGHLPLVEMLVKAGADVSWRSPHGTTPLGLGRKLRRSAVVQFLVGCGATA